LLSGNVICETATWTSVGKTVAGGNGLGSALNQLNNPFGLFVDPNDNDALVIVDNGNGRIMKWEQGARSGQVVAGGNGVGNQTNQLALPRYVTVDKEGTLFITEYTNKRINRWKKGAQNGEIIVSNIFANGITLGPMQGENQYLFVGDWFEARILKFNTNGTGGGEVVVGGKGSGSSLEQLSTRKCVFIQDSITFECFLLDILFSLPDACRSTRIYLCT
jgi:DNA-binding beta-propeller fold protein YncE